MFHRENDALMTSQLDKKEITFTTHDQIERFLITFVTQIA